MVNLSRRSLLTGALASTALMAAPAFAHGVEIFIAGDSIARGWGLGSFTVSPAHPLYAFRSIWSTANLVLEENGAPARMAYLGNGIGDAAGCVTRIQQCVRPGSIVIFEDAGPISLAPAVYKNTLRSLVQAVKAQAARPILMTMFDHAPLHAVNQSIAALGVEEDVTVIDSAALIAVLVNAAWALDGVRIFHDDNVHLNVWGQMRLAGLMLYYSGFQQYVYDVLSAVTIASANCSLLSYGGTMSASRAAEYTIHCLQSPP